MCCRGAARPSGSRPPREAGVRRCGPLRAVGRTRRSCRDQTRRVVRAALRSRRRDGFRNLPREGQAACPRYLLLVPGRTCSTERSRDDVMVGGLRVLARTTTGRSSASSPEHPGVATTTSSSNFSTMATRGGDVEGRNMFEDGTPANRRRVNVGPAGRTTWSSGRNSELRALAEVYGGRRKEKS